MKSTFGTTQRSRRIRLILDTFHILVEEILIPILDEQLNFTFGEMSKKKAKLRYDL
jgi:hypothetical protein